MKRVAKKLSLNAETLRKLSADQLGEVQGGTDTILPRPTMKINGCPSDGPKVTDGGCGISGACNSMMCVSAVCISRAVC